MFIDHRMPWLEPATFIEPTVDQLLYWRELSKFDADHPRLNTNCSACSDSGVREHVTHDARGRRVVYDIECDMCP